MAVFMLSADQPCQRCSSRQLECLYVTKEKAGLVPEFYLRRIDSTLNELKDMIRMDRSHTSSSRGSGEASVETSDARNERNRTISVGDTDSLVEDSTAESFIRKLKEVLQTSNHGSPASSSVLSDSQRSIGSDPVQRRYTVMRFDTLRTSSATTTRSSLSLIGRPEFR